MSSGVAEVNSERLSQEVSVFLSESPTDIQTQDQFVEASAWLTKIATRRKEIEGLFADLIKPFKAAVKNHQDTCKEILRPLNEREVALRQAVVKFRKAELERAQKEQARLNKLHEKKIDRALEKGKDLSDVAPPPVVSAPPKTTKLGQGEVTFRTIKKLAILDEAKIPEKYFDRVLNKKRLETAAFAGNEIPGIQVYTEDEVAVRS